MDFDFALFCKRRIRDDVRVSKGRRGRSTFLYAVSPRSQYKIYLDFSLHLQEDTSCHGMKVWEFHIPLGPTR
jgi:hypothetical protein